MESRKTAARRRKETPAATRLTLSAFAKALSFADARAFYPPRR
jgi:hypothetical protein